MNKQKFCDKLVSKNLSKQTNGDWYGIPEKGEVYGMCTELGIKFLTTEQTEILIPYFRSYCNDIYKIYHSDEIIHTGGNYKNIHERELGFLRKSIVEIDVPDSIESLQVFFKHMNSKFREEWSKMSYTL